MVVPAAEAMMARRIMRRCAAGSNSVAALADVSRVATLGLLTARAGVAGAGAFYSLLENLPVRMSKKWDKFSRPAAAGQRGAALAMRSLTV
jgi:hypothetical protein